MHSRIQNIVESSVRRDSVNSAAVSHYGVWIGFHMNFTEEGLRENEATRWMCVLGKVQCLHKLYVLKYISYII